MTNVNKNIGGLLYLVKKAGSKGFPFRIRLQKIILLSIIEERFPFSFDYSSHYYGPYSVQLQELINYSTASGFLSEEIVQTGDESHGYIYSITEMGEVKLQNIDLSAEEKLKLDRIWERYKDKTTDFVVNQAKRHSGINSRT